MSIIAVDTWREVQNKIVQKIGTQRFNLWLKNTILKSVDDKIAVIGVPNTFILTWIEERLAGEVKAALGEVVKREVEVKFVVDGSLFRRMRNLQAGQQDEAITLKGPGGATHTDCQALNPRFTYERYVVGKCNRFAYEMSRQLIDARGTQFNALLIYGGVGLGKSHLLQAFAREFSRRYPALGVRYVTCEPFVNRFVTAMRQNKLDSFRRLHRGVDALVVDDLHWLAEKKASQEECDRIKEVATAQKSLLTGLYQHCRRSGLMDAIMAYYGMQLVISIYCPPLLPNDVLSFFVNARERKKILEKFRFSE